MRKTLLVLLVSLSVAIGAEPVMMPRVKGPWWPITGMPDLGKLNDPKQQPVDFAVWQAADGTWQVMSCIRKTKEPGRTRLLYQWEGPDLTAKNWAQRGIALQAKESLGESLGGLQAPHVIRAGDQFHLFYGDWANICSARSKDGKTFERHVLKSGKTGLFHEESDSQALDPVTIAKGGNHARDPMLVKINERWHCYYSANMKGKGAVYCRTSTDLETWSDSKVVAFGGQSGDGPYSAECPFVVELSKGEFYLFRTQVYGEKAKTSVYHSRDPLDFGINKDDGHFIGTMALAAPELVQHKGEWYMVALEPKLNGIRAAKLEWEKAK